MRLRILYCNNIMYGNSKMYFSLPYITCTCTSTEGGVALEEREVLSALLDAHKALHLLHDLHPMASHFTVHYVRTRVLHFALRNAVGWLTCPAVECGESSTGTLRPSSRKMRSCVFFLRITLHLQCQHMYSTVCTVNVRRVVATCAVSRPVPSRPAQSISALTKAKTLVCARSVEGARRT